MLSVCVLLASNRCVGMIVFDDEGYDIFRFYQLDWSLAVCCLFGFGFVPRVSPVCVCIEQQQ